MALAAIPKNLSLVKIRVLPHTIFRIKIFDCCILRPLHEIYQYPYFNRICPITGWCYKNIMYCKITKKY